MTLQEKLKRLVEIDRTTFEKLRTMSDRRHGKG